jgi:hypothetical protein
MCGVVFRVFPHAENTMICSVKPVGTAETDYSQWTITLGWKYPERTSLFEDSAE